MPHTSPTGKPGKALAAAGFGVMIDQTPPAAGFFLAMWLAALASVFVGPMPTLTGMPVHCLHGAADVVGQVGELSVGEAGEIQERLVDRVDFDLGGELLQRLHDAAAHVAVERVIAGKDGDAVPLDQRRGP